MHNAHFITKCALNTSQYKNSSQHTWRLCGSSGCGRLSCEAKMLFIGELLSGGNPWYMPSVTDWQAEAFPAAKKVPLPKQESNLIKSSYNVSKAQNSLQGYLQQDNILRYQQVSSLATLSLIHFSLPLPFTLTIHSSQGKDDYSLDKRCLTG